MYIDFENWFGEFVSLKYQISPWREYIHNTKLSFRKYYNIYNYIYEKNYGISFSDYCLNLQGFFRVFIPGFLGGFLYLINTINLLQLDILYSNDSFLKMYDQSFKILLMDDLYYYNDVNIYNFIFNPLQFFSRKIIIFYNILSKISIYRYVYNNIYSNLVSIMYEYIFLVNAFYKESIKIFSPCLNGIYDIYNNFIYNNYEIISSYMYDNIYIYYKFLEKKLYVIKINWPIIWLDIKYYFFCSMEFIAKGVVLYLKITEAPIYISRMVQNVILGFLNLPNYAERYIYMPLEEFFFLTDAYHRSREFRKEYLLADSVILFNHNWYENINSILLDTYYQKGQFIYDSSIIKNISDSFVYGFDKTSLISFSKIKKNDSVNINSIIDDSKDNIAGFGDLDVSFLLIYFFIEHIYYNIFDKYIYIYNNYIIFV